MMKKLAAVVYFFAAVTVSPTWACDGAVSVLQDGKPVSEALHGKDSEHYQQSAIPGTGREQEGVLLADFLKKYVGAREVVIRDCRGSEVVLAGSDAVEKNRYYIAKNKHGDFKLVKSLGDDAKAKSLIKGVCEIDIRTTKPVAGGA